MKKKFSIFGMGLALAVPCCCTTSCVEEQPVPVEETVSAPDVANDSICIELRDTPVCECIDSTYCEHTDTTSSEQE